MSVLYKEIELDGRKSRQKEIVLFDTGATYSVIERSLAESLEDLLPLVSPMYFETAKSGEMLEATNKILLEFHLDEHRLSDEFVVIPNLSERAIIGVLTMQKWKMKLDFEHDQVIVDPKAAKLILK